MATTTTTTSPSKVTLVADRLRSGRYAVRPKGQLGTIGWYPVPWEVQYIKASNEEDAIRRAEPLLIHQC